MRITDTCFTDVTVCARAALTAGRFAESTELLRSAFEAEPRAWWLAMERIRALGRLQPDVSDERQRPTSESHVIFAPDYTGSNSYQRNLYRNAAECGYLIHSEMDIDFEMLAKLIAAREEIVYHQHWVKELYWTATSFDEGVARIDRTLSILKAYKSFGAKVVWTLHNLLDHDASATQARLCCYAHERLASIADRIYVHTRESIDLLSSQCAQNLSSKCYLLEHPLYDDLLPPAQLPATSISKDLPEDAQVLLCLGMIRPYKGVPDLIDAFSIFRQKETGSKVVLVIAGSLHDPQVRERITALPPEVANFVKLIPRRLDDAEVVDLMSRADVAVLPYRQVLISGSYYLATTFGKPVLAPRRGMFIEKIEDGKTGMLYDGTIEGLARAIALVTAMSDQRLSEMGRLARDAAKDLTVRSTSKKYFASLRALTHE